MKIIAIGDIHGRTQWKSIIEKELESADHIVFLGDYFDPYDYSIPDKELLENFSEILELKKAWPTKVILLLGNHDLGAYTDLPVMCDCRTCDWIKSDISKMFKDNWDLFSFTWQYQDILFSHAGLSKEFWDYLGGSNLKKASEFINSFPDVSTLGWCGPYRWGPDKASGIFWADMAETESDKIPGLTQIIGHTRTITRGSKSPISVSLGTAKNWYIDSLESGYYLEILIDKDNNLSETIKQV